MNAPRIHGAPARKALARSFCAIAGVAARVGLAVAMAIVAVIAVAAACLAPTHAAAAPPAGEETRALWVVRHAMTSPGRVDKVIEIAREVNVNTLLVQVRGRGDAFYKSEVAPAGEALGGAPAGFDPLDQMILRAHAAGMEVHAWINVYLVWSAGAPPSSPLHVVNAHPEWISMRADGTRLVEMLPQEFEQERIEGMYLAPGNPNVKRHLREIVREIATRYGVDGIHLDYVRYPEPLVGYDHATRTAFAREFGVDPLQIERPDSTTLAVLGADHLPDLRLKWIRWKRDQVTDLVRALRSDLDLIGRPIKLTAAVIADQNEAVNRYLQDWPVWLKDGVVDAVVPMAYAQSTPVAVGRIARAMSIPNDRQVWAGIAVYNEGARDAADKIRKSRALGVDGIALFSYDTLLASAGYRRSLRAWAFPEATAPTRMPWREKSQ